MDDKKEPGFIRELITFVVLATVIVLPIRLFIAQPFIVSGESMSPTFETGQYLIIDQISYRLKDPQRGDVIVFKFPQNTSKFFIKRIIGLPNETVKIEGTDVTIIKKDGSVKKIDENYITFDRETYSETKLNNDEYFVMGDNRLASLDSRSWGPLNKEFVVGKAFIRLLPLSEIDLLPGKVN